MQGFHNPKYYDILGEWAKVALVILIGQKKGVPNLMTSDKLENIVQFLSLLLEDHYLLQDPAMKSFSTALLDTSSTSLTLFFKKR